MSSAYSASVYYDFDKVYYVDLGVDERTFEDIKQALKRMLWGDRSGSLNVERLHNHRSNSEMYFYSLRLNLSGRLIFTITKEQELVVLEYLNRHQYHRSGYLMGRKDVSAAISGKQKLNLLGEEEAAAGGGISREETFFNPRDLFYYERRFIEFSDSQSDVLTTKFPMLVCGGAGTGKTAIAAKLIEERNSPENLMIYITSSKDLVLKMQRHLGSGGSHQALSIKELLSEKLGMTVVEKEHFIEWVSKSVLSKKSSKKAESPDSNDLFERLRNRQKKESTLSPKDEKILESYLLALKKECKFSTEIVDKSIVKFLGVGLANTTLLIDEAQDFPEALMELLCEALEYKRVGIFIGDHQSLVDHGKKAEGIRQLFREKGKLSIHLLQQNFRSSLEVANSVLRLLSLKLSSQGGRTEKLENWACGSNEGEGAVFWLNRADFADKTKIREEDKLFLRRLIFSPDTAIVAEESEHESLKVLFKFLVEESGVEESKGAEELSIDPTYFLYTPEKVKGLEYKTVIEFRGLSQNKKFAEHLLGLSPRPIQEALVHGAKGNPNFRYQLNFNRVLTSCTRAESVLILVEDEVMARDKKTLSSLFDLKPTTLKDIEKILEALKLSEPPTKVGWEDRAIRLLELRTEGNRTLIDRQVSSIVVNQLKKPDSYQAYLLAKAQRGAFDDDSFLLELKNGSTYEPLDEAMKEGVAASKKASAHLVEGLKERLKKEGLSLKDVPGDGDCFFSAVLDQLAYLGESNPSGYPVNLEESDRDVEGLRWRLGKGFLDRIQKEGYPSFIDKSSFDLERFLRDLIRPGVWTDETVVYWASEYLGVDIRLISESSEKREEVESVRGSSARWVLNLGYIPGVHFCSTRPLIVESSRELRGVEETKTEAPQERVLSEVLRESLLAEKLLEGAQDGNFNLVVDCLKAGVNINSINEKSQTALISAAYARRLDMVKFLLGSGASFELRSINGWTAIHWASYSIPDDPRVLEFLVSTFRDKNFALLDFSVEAFKSLQAFLKQDPSAGIIGKDLKTKIAKGDERNYRSLTFTRDEVLSLRNLLKKRNPDLSALLQLEIDRKDYKGRTPFWIAANYGNVAITDALIALGADILLVPPQSESMEPPYEPLLRKIRQSNRLRGILFAKYFLKPDLLETLKIQKNNWIPKQDTSLPKVISMPNKLPENTSIFIEKFNLYEAFWKASGDGDIITMKDLLSKESIDINYEDKNGRTALCMSAYSRNFDAVEFLLQNGANIFIRARNHRTVLWWACYSIPDDPKIIRYLISWSREKDNCALFDWLYVEFDFLKRCLNNHRGPIKKDLQTVIQKLNNIPDGPNKSSFRNLLFTPKEREQVQRFLRISGEPHLALRFGSFFLERSDDSPLAAAVNYGNFNIVQALIEMKTFTDDPYGDLLFYFDLIEKKAGTDVSLMNPNHKKIYHFLKEKLQEFEARWDRRREWMLFWCLPEDQETLTSCGSSTPFFGASSSRGSLLSSSFRGDSP